MVLYRILPQPIFNTAGGFAMRGKPKLITLRDQEGNILSENWYIHYYDGERSRRISTGCKIGTQDHEANLALASFTLERERPSAKNPDQLLITQALRDYYEEHGQYTVSAKKLLCHENRLKEHFLGQFVSQITPSIIAGYVRKCEERKESNGTIRRDLEHLNACLNHEVREQRLIYAPKFKLPPPPAPRERILSEEEITRLLRLSKPKAPTIENMRLYAFLVLMLSGGQRPGTVEGLTWFQVDFEEGIIGYDKTGKKQTNKRVRPVPMSAYSREVLEWMHEHRVSEFVLGWRKKAGTVRTAFTTLCRNAGIEGVGRYTLRHTFANRVVTDEKTRADLMGHTSVKTTRHHYIKTNMDKLREAVESASPSAHLVRKTKNPKNRKSL